MSEFSDDLIREYRRFQKLKRAAALERIGQYTGAAAEVFATGRPASEALAAREPQFDIMTRQQKLQAQREGVQRLGQIEQFQVGTRLQAELDMLRMELDKAKAILTAGGAQGR
jgi:hypothetical protein